MNHPLYSKGLVIIQKDQPFLKNGGVPTSRILNFRSSLEGKFLLGQIHLKQNHLRIPVVISTIHFFSEPTKKNKKTTQQRPKPKRNTTPTQPTRTHPGFFGWVKFWDFFSETDLKEVIEYWKAWRWWIQLGSAF